MRFCIKAIRGKADALPRFFGQADGIIFKQAVRLDLCGVALMYYYLIRLSSLKNIKPLSAFMKWLTYFSLLAFQKKPILARICVV